MARPGVRLAPGSAVPGSSFSRLGPVAVPLTSLTPISPPVCNVVCCYCGLLMDFVREQARTDRQGAGGGARGTPRATPRAHRKEAGGRHWLRGEVTWYHWSTGVLCTAVGYVRFLRTSRETASSRDIYVRPPARQGAGRACGHWASTPTPKKARGYLARSGNWRAAEGGADRAEMGCVAMEERTGARARRHAVPEGV